MILSKYRTRFDKILLNSYIFYCSTSIFKDYLFNIQSRYSTGKPQNDYSINLRENDWMDKIIYNEVFLSKKKYRQRKILKNRTHSTYDTKIAFIQSKEEEKCTPFFLNYIKDNSLQEKDTEGNEESNNNTQIKSQIVHFPFHSKNSVLDQSEINNTNDNLEIKSAEKVDFEFEDYEAPNQKLNYMKKKKKTIDYESPVKWTFADEEDNEIILSDKRFGSCDPKVPISSVACGGCGALLHCTDMSIPGFMPKEIFTTLNEQELRAQICQRCLFLQEYNVALGINVKAEEYPIILGKIKNEKALVILLVDLLDFPCSIWPGIANIIGSKRPVFLVGNKIDLLVQDGDDHTKHVKKCLEASLMDIGMTMFNIKHVALISAKTGFGIENLITNLHTVWSNKGNVYIVGCTNSGKSTLFNSLIQSDYCKVKASDLLQRATISNWPGTTLNLLKFPILKPSQWRLFIRSTRLKAIKKEEEALLEIQKKSVKLTGKNRQLSLMGYIGRTFRNKSSDSDTQFLGIDPEDPAYKDSKWCFDTPGVVHEDQILNLLTTSELSKVIPKVAVIPRNFKLKHGQCLFIGGIARLDYIHGKSFVWFTVYASMELPVTIVNTEDADLLYKKLIGTEYFAVPHGSEERIKKFPSLVQKELQIFGKYKSVASADVVLSSAGWVAVTVDPGYSCTVCAWSPGGRGIHLRKPALIRHSCLFKGNKIRGTPAYDKNIDIVENVDLPCLPQL